MHAAEGETKAARDRQLFFVEVFEGFEVSWPEQDVLILYSLNVDLKLLLIDLNAVLVIALVNHAYEL